MRRRSQGVGAVVSGGALVCALLLAGGGRAQSGGLRTCTQDEYALLKATTLNRTPRGAAVAAVGLYTEDLASPCNADVTVTLDIRSRGRHLPARGSPKTTHIVKVLHPWGHVVHGWAWRNWCGGRRHSAMVVFRIPGTRVDRDRFPRRPRCRDPRRRSRLVSMGTARNERFLPPSGEAVPGRFIPKDWPHPPSRALLRYRNGWMVSDGRTHVSLYAGAEGADADVGLFVVYKTDFTFGFQDWHPIAVPGQTGYVKIVDPPLGKEVETSAQSARIPFVSESGAPGTFNLDGDTVSLQSP